MSLITIIANLVDGGSSLHIFRDPVTGRLSESIIGALPGNPTVSDFVVTLLSYLNGKRVLPNRKGAFSFVCGYDTEMYLFDETGYHFVYVNQEYASVFFSFGGSPYAKVNSRRDAPKLSASVKYQKIQNETTFCESLLDRYDAVLPFYNLPQPIGSDFENPVVDSLYNVFASAGCGVLMKYDCRGKLTPERFRLNLEKTKEIAKYVPISLLNFPFLRGFLEASLSHYCDLNLLIEVAELLHEQTIGNEVKVFDDFFRLFYVSNGAFAQALGLDSVPKKYDYAARQAMLFDLIVDVDEPLYRARHINEANIENELRRKGLKSVEYGKYGRRATLSMPPIDVVMEVRGKTLFVSTNDELWSVSTEHAVDKDARFHPTAKVTMILESLVYPMKFVRGSDMENPEDEIYSVIAC